MNNNQKLRRLSGNQILAAVLVSLIAAAVLTFGAAVKMFFISGVRAQSLPVVLMVPSAASVLFLTCFCLFLYSTDISILQKKNYLISYVTVIVFASLCGIYLPLISPLFIPVAFAAILAYPLVRKNSSAFIINVLSALFTFSVCASEYILLNGEVKTLIGESGMQYLWILLTMTIISISAGGIIPYVIRHKTRRTRYILACLAFNLVTYALTVGTFMLEFNAAELFAAGRFDLLWCPPVAIFAPLVASLILAPLIESLFNLVTDARLAELTDVKQPLLARLSGETPGTFNHSLSVANLAEICANAIGENPYLARAAAYYHDIGKLDNPEYFSENQAPNENPLDDLLPEVSAEIIRKHAEKGYRLCKSARLPDEICAVTVEHHGTMPIRVFYERAKQLTDGEIDMNDYCYHGQTPTSKIAAIIMLCDTSEAAIRAMNKPDGEKVDLLIRGLIDERLKLGQFDNCDISVKELGIIRNSIIEAHGGILHKRVKYPDGEK